MNTIYHRTTCRLCDSSRLELVVPYLPTPIADAYVSESNKAIQQELYPLDLYFCRDCSHLQLCDVVNPELLFRNYTYVTSVSLGLVEHFRQYAENIVSDFAIREGSLVVEIGSNDGSLLRFFKNKGMRVIGVDPALTIARNATENGIETLAVFFSMDIAKQLYSKHGTASVIAANNVFAHADNLGEISDGIRELLKDDGVFIFEVSNLADIVQKMLFDTIYHEHLSYHSVISLSSFFKRRGLDLFDVQGIPTKAGSIRGFVQKIGGPRQISESIEKQHALEIALGLDHPQVFREFAKKIDACRTNLTNLINEIMSQGKKIAGYGASATVTTLLYNLKLQNSISVLFDDNPVKHGTLSPGVHIPVVPSNEIYHRRPDYIIILAWNYADSIMKRHVRYLEEGGRFISPLPDVRICSA